MPVLDFTKIKLSNIKIKSGDTITKSGLYVFSGHVKPNDLDCFILKNEKKMFFSKGSEAPRPLSCLHDVEWRLVTAD